MAIGTALAIAGATIGGSILSSRSQNRASRRAAATAQTTANTNNALAQNIYNQNSVALAPFQQRGNAAGAAINSLMGIGQGATPSGQPTAIPQSDYNNAFQNYQNSTGYQFRMGEGVRALNSSASARGVRNSGAAAKSAMRYGQGIGSAEFGNYLAQLANQQSVGLSGASAQAGVGQNYVNTVTANNNSAGTAAANAALLRGQSTANMWGQIGGAVGNVFGSSFG